MAKKKQKAVAIKPEQPKKPIKMYEFIKPGECPFCGKGPVVVVVRDQYPVVIDKDGYAMTLGNITNQTYGICANCRKSLGEYEQRLFKWFPVEHPFKDLEHTQSDVRPSYNFFGNKEEQCLGGGQEWIMHS